MVEAAELALVTLAKRNQLLPVLTDERVDEGVVKTGDGSEFAEAIGYAL
jgi:hypothetical protein